jgi:F-type H+-transporting ATPase subunit b
MGEFFSNPENWVALGFLAFIALVGKRAYAFIGSALDQRSAAIKSNLDEALRLREEAQSLLASYQRKQREAESEAKDIIDRAKAEAESMAQDAVEAIEASVKRRSELALDRIGQAEAKALKQVRETAIDMAIRGAERLIIEGLDETKADKMVDDAIKDLGKKLH